MAVSTVVQEKSCVEVAERVSAEEFLRIAPEDRKAELIDGVIIEIMPPLTIHERLQRFLYTLPTLYEERENGEVFGSRTPVVLSEYYAPEPDILFISSEQAEIIQRDGIHGAPDLVIEILSVGTAKNDRGPKFLAYEEAGVRELWLIDPYGPAGTDFYQLEQGSFRPVHPDAKSIMRSVAIPGFWIDVRWLWPDKEKFLSVRKALEEVLGE